jgi:cyclopropane fatty-acyl-phospholipid synthase-like methyltransferase
MTCDINLISQIYHNKSYGSKKKKKIYFWVMHERHKNRELYFREQAHTTRKYVMPFISSVLHIDKSLSVLEIGCGEGGNLLPFLETGCARITGVDISQNKIDNALKFFSGIPGGEMIEFIAADILIPDQPALLTW